MISGFFKRLLMARQLDFLEGKIEIFNTKYVLHPVTEQVFIQDTLIEKFGEDGKKIIYESGEKCSKEISDQLFEKFKVKGLESMNLWQNLIELSGMAKVTSISTEKNSKVLVKAESSLAKNLFEKKGKTKGLKADYYLSGFIGGVISKVYGKELVCTEIKCIAEGEPECVFILE